MSGKLAAGRQDRDNFVRGRITVASNGGADSPVGAEPAQGDVLVRTIRPHDTQEGWKNPGDEYQRTQSDADKLAAAGVVSIV